MVPDQRVKVKICGITRVEDGLAAAAAGADAIGLVFYPPSPRHVTLEQARLIVAALPPFVTVVGLFVNESDAAIRTLMSQVPLDILQFHGNEPADFCATFGRRYIKAVHMKDNVDLHAAGRQYATASALLVDTYCPHLVGGTGKTFDWQQLPTDLDCPLILAGGLNPDNVSSAIATAQPWGVDVSGGVETLDADGKPQGGIKSPTAIEAFIQGVRCDEPY